MSAGSGLPNSFWDEFLKRDWGRRPRLFRGCLETPLATADELFHCLVAGGGRLRAREDSGPAHLYREDGFFLPETRVGSYLPEPGDGSLAGYVDRITRLLEGRRFALLYHHLFSEDARLWLRARDLLAPLSRRVPGLQVKETLFFGNYDSTPFGVHRDEVAVFMIVLEGRKRMLFWSDGVFQDRNDRSADDYRAHREQALTLEAGPGDLLYWPQGLWHVGEPVPGVSVSLNFGMAASDPTDQLATFAAGLIRQHSGTGEHPDAQADAPESRQGFAEAPSAWLRWGAETLKRAAEDPAATQPLIEERLRRETRSGLLRAPAPLPWRTLPNDARVRTSRTNPVRWLAAAHNEIICAANGHSFRIPASPRVIEMLQRLNTGGAFSVGELVNDHAGLSQASGVCFRSTPGGIRTVLSKLCTLRALLTGPEAEGSTA